MKTYNVLTIFPEMITSAFSQGVLSRGIEEGLIAVNPVFLREYTHDRHRTTDDYQYGGGVGLVMKPEPIVEAVRDIKSRGETRVILMDPRGRKFTQKDAERLSQYDSLTFLCGRYEGYDERVRQLVVDEELSIGDFVLSGGEFAAMTMIDSIARLIPGVLGDEDSIVEESFTSGLLEYPHYTRPAEYEGLTVPEVLTSGHHGQIDDWRLRESLRLTSIHRPDLLRKAELSPKALKMLKELNAEPKPEQNIYVALMHYPMYDKQKDIVATSVTNIDLHDISRSCATFGVKRYFVVTPLAAQQEICNRVFRHWREGFGATYNANRKEAFDGTVVKSSLMETLREIEKREGKPPKIVATTARKNRSNIGFRALADVSRNDPILILFGTGWGFTDDIFRLSDYVLEPVQGAGAFNHLSVRSAVAIILDRLTGNQEDTPCGTR